MPKKVIIPIDKSADARSLEITIPDVVIKNTVSADGLSVQTSYSQAAITWSLPPATPIPANPTPIPEPIPDPSGQAMVYTMKRISGDIPNCGRQLCDFGTPTFPYKSKSLYDRWSWALVETSKGVLNTSLLKGLFDKAKANKQTVNFRIGMFDSGGGSWGSVPNNGIACYYPAYVHAIMQAESVKDFNNGKVWLPNWNSPGMQTAWAAMIKLLVKWLKDNDYYKMLDFIDLGPYGDYEGEGHMYGFDDVQKQNKTTISDASQIFFMDTMLNAFNDLPVIGNQALLDPRYASDAVGYYALTAKNDFGPMGFRNDHLSQPDWISSDKQRMNKTVQGLNFNTEYSKRYLKSPMIGELMNDAGAVNSYASLINNVKDFGLVQFENSGVVKTALAQTNVMNAVKEIGVIGIDTVTVNADGSYSVQYFNTGKPPLYWPWKVQFIAGANSLSVKLVDPTGYREPYFLANEGRQADGSYKIV
jgi:hypothetical protein